MAQPLTLTFSAWLPDLANVGQQMGYLPAASIPAADLLNVFYSDSSYRCLPAPAAIGPTLGVQVTNATNFYDNASGEEIVFAGTANGLYMLEAGAWSAVPIVTNTGLTLVGNSMQMSVGTLTVLSYSISPQQQSQTSNTSSFIFSNVTVHAPGATSFTWALTGQVGTGTWSFGGQGTATATSPAVSGVPSSSMSNINLQCTIGFPSGPRVVSSFLSYSNNSPGSYSGTLVAGDYFDPATSDIFLGYWPTSPGGPIGSLSPTVDIHGHTIQDIFYDTQAAELIIDITGFSADPGRGYFSTILINGVGYSTSAAGSTYAYGGGDAGWTIPVASSPFAAGSSYSIQINY